MKSVRIQLFCILFGLLLSGCSNSEQKGQTPSQSEVTPSSDLGDGMIFVPDEDQVIESESQGNSGYEEPFDADRDGIPDFADVDAGGDGVASGLPPTGEMGNPYDADGDGIPNSVDWDKDGDGIPDA